MSKYLLVTFCLLVANFAHSQQIFNKNSELNIEFSKTNVPFYTHTFEKGQSLYGLSTVFNTTVSAIVQLNHVTSDNIAEGTKIVFPLKASNIEKNIESSKQAGPFIPIYYETKKGETLYRISKLYCNEDVNQFKKRNNLKSNDISVGQKLIIGWLPLNGPAKVHSEQVNTRAENSKDDKYLIGPTLPKNEEKKLENPSVEEPMTKVEDDVAEVEKEEAKWVNTRGVAVWNKNFRKQGSNLVLHSTAKINSEIELYNPMVKRTVRAKVIGRIPVGMYPDDVDIVLSTTTANSLGALDSRLMLSMKYVQ